MPHQNAHGQVMVASVAESNAIPQQLTASAKVLWTLVAAVERAGVPREEYLKVAAVDLEQLEQPEARISVHAMIRCAELALELTGDPALGLRWGDGLTARSFSIVTHLLRQAATPRQAFELLFQYNELLTDRKAIRLIEGDSEVVLDCGEVQGVSLRVKRLCAELALIGFYRMLRDFGAGTELRRVSMKYPAPSYRSEYTRIFEGIERFDQPFTGLVFDRSFMDIPFPHHDEELESTLRSLAERRMTLLRNGSTYAQRVRNLLIQQSAPHLTAAKTVAGWLNVSERSLYRHLAEEGQPYRVVADDAAVHVATRLLTEERRSIQETAFMMGFANGSTFHRAFKRWTGTTPTKLRAQR